MRITCDAVARMGYIYLMCTGNKRYSKNIEKYVDESMLKISILEEKEIAKELDKLTISNKIYRQAVEVDFSEECQNDLDKHGYMMGIELYISKDEFIEKIKKEAFKIYLVNWRIQDFTMVTFDLQKEVFKTGNIIYPLTAEMDAFVIVDVEPRYNTGLIKALISSRNDIYPLEHLAKAEFILYEE